VRETNDDDTPRPPSPYRMVGIGFELAAGVLIGVLGGGWVDRKLGTAPWGLLVGTLLGAASSFYGVVRQIRPPTSPGGGGRR